MNVFVLLNTKEDILKNVGNRAVLGHYWLPCNFFSTVDVNGAQNSLVTSFLLNIYICVQQNKDIHTGLELLEGELITFTFIHLADTFIQSNLQCIQVIHLLSVCVFPGNWTHNLCAANAMLYHWATGTQNRNFNDDIIFIFFLCLSSETARVDM